MSDLEAIIFDLDGVLADTVEYHFRAWQRIADLLGVPFTRTDMDQFRGRQRRDCLLLLLGDHRLDSATFERYMLLKDEFYMADAAAMTTASLLPGVLPFIQEAHESGLKMGVASSSQSAHFILQQTGILAYMDVVGDGGTVARSKPAPDIFLWVAGALRTAPKDIVVFEDSLAGIEAARTAGMFVVGIGESISTEEAHVWIPGLEHLRLSDLIDTYLLVSGKAKPISRLISQIYRVISPVIPNNRLVKRTLWDIVVVIWDLLTVLLAVSRVIAGNDG